MSVAPKPSPTITRSKDFKYIYSNHFSVIVSGEEVVLKLGIVQDPTDQENSVMEECGIVLSLIGAKTVAYVINAALSRLEKDNNLSIPIPDERLAAIDAAVQVSRGKP